MDSGSAVVPTASHDVRNATDYPLFGPDLAEIRDSSLLNKSQVSLTCDDRGLYCVQLE